MSEKEEFVNVGVTKIREQMSEREREICVRKKENISNELEMNEPRER